MEKRNQPATDLVLIPEDSPKLSRIRIQVVEMSEIPLDEVVAPGKIEVNPNRVSRVATEMVASEQTGGLSEEQVIFMPTTSSGLTS